MLDFLMHDERDDVGVAVVDIKAGQVVRGQSLHGKAVREVKTLVDIPLGHKLALRDFKPGDTVTKYGCDIGRVVAPIKTGEHVHVVTVYRSAVNLTSPSLLKKCRKSVVFDKNVASIFLLYHCIVCLYYGL